jgi:hypothetical protein
MAALTPVDNRGACQHDEVLPDRAVYDRLLLTAHLRTES